MVLPQCLPSLGKWLFPGDPGIRLDFQHFMAEITDKCNSNHPSLAGALKELNVNMHIVHQADIGKPAAMQRKLRPPPHVSMSVSLSCFPPVFPACHHLAHHVC